MKAKAQIKYLGQQDYHACWLAMKDFTEQRNSDTPDQLWIVEHPQVFTLGQAGKPEHILNAKNIPIAQSDRGGQVTYHGPGQIIIYTLIDIKRLGIGARALVSAIENSIIESLANISIDAFAKKDAPGVYVDTQANTTGQEINDKLSSPDAKIAALGLRIRKGCSYHGLSINFDMNLEPFSYINPCGYEGQSVTQVKTFQPSLDKQVFEANIIQKLCEHLQLKMVTEST